MSIETIFDKIVERVCMDLIEYEWWEVPEQRMLKVKLNDGLFITNNSVSLDEKDNHYFHIFSTSVNYEPKNFIFRRDFDEKQVDDTIKEIVESLKEIEKFRILHRVWKIRKIKEVG